MRDESQTELLLDILGDEEPIRVPKQQISNQSSNQTSRYRVEVHISNKAEECSRDSEITAIKQEEFDVDDFLSNENDEYICPSSPESEPSSPYSSDGDIDDIVKLCCETETSLVGDTTFNGCGIKRSSQFIDEEFLLSCESADLSTASSIVDMDDPFSDLFPSLLSV